MNKLLIKIRFYTMHMENNLNLFQEQHYNQPNNRVLIVKLKHNLVTSIIDLHNIALIIPFNKIK